MTDWETIREEYITTDISGRKLAQKAGVKAGTLFGRAAREGWAEQKERFSGEEGGAALQARRTARLLSVADKLLGKVEVLLDGTEPEGLNPQVLRGIGGALKDIKAVQMICSDADLREQEARIASLIKRSQSEERSAAVTVVLEGELKDYAQ